MILTCPACQTRYTVDAAKFPAEGRNVRCARCSEVWHAMPEVEAPAPDPVPEPEIYAQPEPQPAPRAPEPPPESDYSQEDDAYSAPAAPVSKPAKAPFKPNFIMLGWVALAVFVIVLGLSASLFRQQIVAAWPKSASLYAAAGIKVAESGLKLGDTASTRENKGGQLVLTVSGAVTNVAAKELPVPQIRVGLVDRDKRELYHWIVAPEVMVLKPGQTTRFVTRLSNPPAAASNYEVRFAKAGE